MYIYKHGRDICVWTRVSAVEHVQCTFYGSLSCSFGRRATSWIGMLERVNGNTQNTYNGCLLVWWEALSSNTKPSTIRHCCMLPFSVYVCMTRRLACLHFTFGNHRILCTHTHIHEHMDNILIRMRKWERDGENELQTSRRQRVCVVYDKPKRIESSLGVSKAILDEDIQHCCLCIRRYIN